MDFFSIPKTYRELIEPFRRELDDIFIYRATQIEEISSMLAETGYAYDAGQNIFYSVLNPWQRKLGYCSLYDEASAPLGLVFDCEPFRFEYGGKQWLIELWKGQYGMTSGGEVGIYNTTMPNLDIPGIFNGTFYQSASDSEMLSMTYTLLKSGKYFFSRAGVHWWLTGFRLGEFYDPSELSMEVSITFRDGVMLAAFTEALQKAGYRQGEYRISGNTVLIVFSKPHAPQPLLRQGIAAEMALEWDKLLVTRYAEIVGSMTDMAGIFNVLKEQAPDLYTMALGMGRQKSAYTLFDAVQPFVSEL